MSRIFLVMPWAKSGRSSSVRVGTKVTISKQDPSVERLVKYVLTTDTTNGLLASLQPVFRNRKFLLLSRERIFIPCNQWFPIRKTNGAIMPEHKRKQETMLS